MRAYARNMARTRNVGRHGLIQISIRETPTLDEHPLVGRPCGELGWPEDIVSRVGHSRELDVPLDTLMAKSLFAVDE